MVKKSYILLFKFNKEFYLACNPDVKTKKFDARKHYREYGYYEQRIFSIKECEVVVIDKKDTIQFQNYLNLSSGSLRPKNSNVSIILLPWRAGCWGRPFQFVRVTIISLSRSKKTIFNLGTILYAKESFHKTDYLLEI